MAKRTKKTEALTTAETIELPVVIEAQAPATIPEAPATEEVDPSQAEAERAYGEETLNDLLKLNSSVEAFMSCLPLEPSVMEAIYRRLTIKTAPVNQAPKVRTSSVKGPCAIVWELASSMPDASRAEVVAAAMAQGVATNTARTQYQHWKSAGKAPKFEPKKA